MRGILFSLIIFQCGLAYSQDQYDYPELLTVPSAADMVTREAKTEAKDLPASYRPIQLSALLNIVAGAMVMGEDAKKDGAGEETTSPKLAGAVGIGIGAGLIASTYWLGNNMHMYREGLRSIRRMPTKSRKDQLAYQRSAEEVLQATARRARTIRLLGVAANVVASGFIISQSDEQLTKITAGLGALSVAGAYLFPPYQIAVKRNYRDYKKRIYGPIAHLDVSHLGFRPGPALALSWPVSL